MSKNTKRLGIASLLCFIGAFILFFVTTFISVLLNIMATNRANSVSSWGGSGSTIGLTPLGVVIRKGILPILQIGVPILLIMASLVLVVIFIIFLCTDKK